MPGKKSSKDDSAFIRPSTIKNRTEPKQEAIIDDLESIRSTLDTTGLIQNSEVTSLDGDFTLAEIPLLEDVTGHRTPIQNHTSNPFLSSKTLESLVHKRNEAEAKAAEDLAHMALTQEKTESLFDTSQLPTAKDFQRDEDETQPSLFDDLNEGATEETEAAADKIADGDEDEIIEVDGAVEEFSDEDEEQQESLAFEADAEITASPLAEEDSSPVASENSDENPSEAISNEIQNTSSPTSSAAVNTGNLDVDLLKQELAELLPGIVADVLQEQIPQLHRLIVYRTNDVVNQLIEKQLHVDDLVEFDVDGAEDH